MSLPSPRSRFFPALGLLLFSLLPCPKAEAEAIRLNIDAALDQALQCSSVLKHARLDYAFEKARHALSLRAFLPELTIGYSREDAVVSYAPDTHRRRMFIGIDQMVFAGGTGIRERKAAAQELRLRRWEIAAMERNLRMEVVSRYVEILKLGLQIRILGESLSSGREQVLIAAEELRVGEITRLDYVEMELSVQDLEIELGILEQEQESMHFELAQLLEIDPDCSLELSGSINPNYRGMLPEQDPGFYLAQARRNSLDLKHCDADINQARLAVEQARSGWLPRVSAQVEMGVAGEQFPLTDPAFSVGLDLDFATPLIPFHSDLSAGTSRAGERSLGVSSSADIGENLNVLQSHRIARIELYRAEVQRHRQQRNLEYSIHRQFDSRNYLLENLLLEARRLQLQQRRHEIEAVMLDIGEITRVEFLQSGIELVRQRVDQLSRIVSLFQLESNLLAVCAPQMLESAHKRIVLAGAGN